MIFCILLTIFVSDVFGFLRDILYLSILTGPLDYRPEDGIPVSFVSRGKGLFCSPNCPDLHWGPHNLLLNGNRGHLLEKRVAGECEGGVTPTLSHKSSRCGVQLDAFCSLCKNTSVSVLVLRSDTKFHART